MPTVTTTAQEADRLERAMNALKPKLSVSQEIAVWDTWQDHGEAAAQRVLTAMKEARSPMTMTRYKDTAPAGIIDQALARLGMACRERARIDGDQPIADYLNKMADAISPTQGTAGGSLGDSEKITKEVRTTDLLDGVFVAIQQGKHHSF